jgi:redox-sensitive bicupin YhaK (pirin superfamily)
MIEIVIPFRQRSIGSMDVKRILPYSKRRSVGPFVFVDEMGPVEIVQNQSLDVLSHPHIGLATVTYLFSGKMTHRDSLGTVQVIEPGEVNLMSAGRGIVHSERASDAGNTVGENLLGLQTWIALPENLEESAPDFAHHSSAELPLLETEEGSLKIILGEFGGKKSPVQAPSKPFYAECVLQKNKVLQIPATIQERAVYLLSGTLEIEGQTFTAGNMIVFAEGKTAEVKAIESAKFMIIGGERLEKPRFMWWNFVSTSQELIEKAKEDWRKGNFEMIPNETGYVPLPEGNYPKPKPNIL